MKIIKKTGLKLTLIMIGFFGYLVVLSVGISSGEYHHFPYGFIPHKYIYEIYKGRKHPSDLKELQDRYLKQKLIDKREICNIKETDSLGVYVTYGQSNTTNSGQYGYKTKFNVYEYHNKKIYKYEDPTIGGGITSHGGTVWGILGDLLIESKKYNKVIFSISGKGGQTIKQLSNGINYDRLLKDYTFLKKKFGKVDGILFHQGESNNFRLAGSEYYYEDFKSFLEKMISDSINSKIYLSRASYIVYGDDKELIKIQNNIINDFKQVMEGPYTDKFNLKEDRLPDGTHFSLLGYEKFAKEWMVYLGDN